MILAASVSVVRLSSFPHHLSNGVLLLMKIVQRIILLFVLILPIFRNVVAGEGEYIWSRIGSQGGGSASLIFSNNQHPDTLYTVMDSSGQAYEQLSTGQYFKSINGGASWVMLPFSVQGNKELNQFPINDLVVSSSDPNILFAISNTWDQPSQPILLKSTDGGMSWYQIAKNIDAIDTWSFKTLNSPITKTLKVLFSSENFSGYGVAISHDEGESWQIMEEKISQIDGTQPIILARDPVNPEIIFGTYFINYPRTITTAGLFKSTNAGKDWIDISPQPSFEISEIFLTYDSDKFYAIFNGDSSRHFVTTYDGGESWEELGKLPSDQSIDYSLENVYLSPSDSSTLYATLTPDLRQGEDQWLDFQRIAKSTDSGKSWQLIDVDQYVPNSIYIHPDNNQSLILTTSNQGVVKSDNGGLDWYVSNKIKFQPGQIIDDLDDSTLLYYQSNIYQEEEYLYKTDNSGNSGERINFKYNDAPLYCDDVIINPVKNSEMFCVRSFVIYISYDSGETWLQLYILLNSSSDYRWITQLSYTIDGKTLFMVTKGDEQSIKVSDGGLFWETISDQFGELVLHPSDPEVVFNVTDNNGEVKLLKSTDRGQNWSELIHSSHRYGHKLLIHPSHPERLIFQDGENTFLLSEDGGENWNEILKAYNNSSQGNEVNQPFKSIYNLVFNPDNSSGLIAETDSGTFSSLDLGETWSRINLQYNEQFDSSGIELTTTLNSVYATSDSGTYKLVPKIDSHAVSNCLFDWAENKYPDSFASSSETNQWRGYYYRYYAETNAYLGFFLDQEVHLLQPDISTKISTHGDIQYYQNLSGCK